MAKRKTPIWISGYVNWYDPSSRRGSIISDDGIWYRIQDFSEIQTKKQQVLREKTRVVFELAPDSVDPIIKTVRQSDEITETKRKRLDSKEL